MNIWLQFFVICGCAVMVSAESLEDMADLTKRQCRSIHLGFQSGTAEGFYNEVRVTQSSVGTYFCVAGFSFGYFGLQERERDKLVIFSVWDPGQQDDQNSVAAERRVKLIYKDPAVTTGRFGNEGTGGQSFFTHDWKTNETYRFAVSAKPQGQRTTFGAYFFLNETRQWRHLVSFETETGGQTLKGLYAFIEDFQRDYVSATRVRSADFGPTFVLTKSGGWEGLTQARFTGDVTPSWNINAGAREDRFFLITGGATVNQTPLHAIVTVEQSGKMSVPPPF